MKKRSYKSVKVNDVDAEKLMNQVRGIDLVVGNDVAKTTHVAALMDEQRHVLLTIRWDMPQEMEAFVSLLRRLPAASLAVAMEPSGSYGDPLRHQLCRAGIAVFRVSPKRVHDAAEEYDGVPSRHDAKSAALIAKLSWDGAGERWEAEEEPHRERKAALSVMDRYARQLQQNVNRLEGMLARCWPEAPAELELGSCSLLRLLSEVGGPEAVRRDRERSRRVLRKAGGSQLKPEKIERVLRSSETTVGVPLTGGELSALQDLAGDALRAREQYQKWKRKVEQLTRESASVRAMSEVVGSATAAVLSVEVGDPRKYADARSYEKAAGLNLKEHSSGKHSGCKKITKRGSGMARRWLYLAVLRRIQGDRVFRAWYERKVARDGGKPKGKAIVALMRKLIRALWHVGQGEVFDPGKLFDVRRLKLADA